jgi:hypothetical protein
VVENEKIRDAIVANDTDACRFLISSLVNMLRTSKSGVLCDPEVRSVLADRLENALAAKADEVSDALGITRNRSASSKYGSCKYDFMMWYWGFMDEKKQPTGEMQSVWLDNYPGDSPSHPSSTVNGWIAEAKENHSAVLKGATTIHTFL